MLEKNATDFFDGQSLGLNGDLPLWQDEECLDLVMKLCLESNIDFEKYKELISLMLNRRGEIKREGINEQIQDYLDNILIKEKTIS